MCWMCEQDDLAAAYQDYLAQRQAASAGPAAAARDDAAQIDPDWAIGTWFAPTKPVANE